MTRYHTSEAVYHDVSEHITDAVMAHIAYSCGTTARIGGTVEDETHGRTHYLEAEAKRDRAEQRAHPFRYRLQQVETERGKAADKLLWETKRRYQPEEENMQRFATSEQQGEMTEPEAHDALMTQDLAIWDLESKRYRDRTVKDDDDDDEAAREVEYYQNRGKGSAHRDLDLTLEERVRKQQVMERRYREQRDKRREKFHPIRTEFINLEKERHAAEDKRQMDTYGTSPSEYVIQTRREDDRFHRQMIEKQAREALKTAREALRDPEGTAQKESDALHKAYNDMIRSRR
jgi:hypothetical protein